MWLSVAVMVSTASLFVAYSTNIGSMGLYIGYTAKCFSMVSVIVLLINDTLVFMAVMVGLVKNTHLEPTLKEGIRVVMYGNYLPAFSRAIIKCIICEWLTCYLDIFGMLI